jgi:DNA repair exonuclease SbcCD nuclease subunit
MRLLLFADLHLDAAFKWAGPELARRRRQALRDTLRNILTLSDEVDANALLCAGDLYEQERFTPDTREFLRREFGATHRPIFISPGNHDPFCPQSLYAQVAWSSNVTIFREPHLAPVDLAEGLTLWGAAFDRPTRPAGFFDSGFRVDRGGVNLALFHGSERSALAAEIGGKSPHAPFDAAGIREAGLVHAFVGHYHQPRDAEALTYPGNPDPLTFGESGDRGAVIVDVDRDGSLRRKRRAVGVSQVHDVEVDASGSGGCQEILDRAAVQLAGLHGVVRLTVTGEIAPDVDLDLDSLRRLPHDLDADPIVRTRLRVGYDLESIAREPTVRGRFVQDVLAANDLDEPDRQRILATGLRSLDGRDDLEVP